jgi:TonB family protein
VVHATLTGRRRKTGSLTAAWVTSISLALHLLGWLGVEAMGGLRGSEPLAPRDAAAEALAKQERGPKPSCEGDELLASAARMFVCAFPSGGGEACVRETIDGFGVARERCDRVEMPSAVTLLDPRRVAEIEPEPLMDLIEPEVLAQIQAEAAQKAQQQEQTPPPPAPPQAANMQVVETAPQENQPPPENTRFLADYDSSVEKQTVARGTTEQMVARPEPSPQDTKEIPQPGREQPAKDTAGQEPESAQGAGALAMREPGLPQTGKEAQPEVTPGLLNGSDAPLGANGFQARRGTGDRFATKQEALDPTKGENGGGGGGKTLPNLRPTPEALERALGGGSVDHLDDVAEGEQTALNAKQWKFASFFNRAKRQVAQNWNPNRVIVSKDPSGKVYGVKDRITVLRVTLDGTGHLTDVHVVETSGVGELDEEAMRAFRAAEPFPNPPPALVDPSGKISFLFHFHLQMVERSFGRLFK